MDDHHELKHRYRNYFGVYNRYSVPGFIVLLFGICLLGLGIFDVAWTVTRYGSTCTQNSNYPAMMTCEGNHIFTLVGSSLWGGAMLIIDGVMALWMPHRYIGHSCVFNCYTFLTFINLVGFAPAIVVLNALEISMNNNIFYTYVDNEFTVADPAKFAVVFTIAILGGLEFLLSAGVLLVSCLCPAPKRYRQNFQRPFIDWHPHMPHMPHFPHPNFGKNQPPVNPYGRPMMYNPGMMPRFGPPMANPYGQNMAMPCGPQLSNDPYRFYNAMSGYAMMNEARRPPPHRGYRRRRDDYNDSDYDYDD